MEQKRRNLTFPELLEKKSASCSMEERAGAQAAGISAEDQHKDAWRQKTAGCIGY